MPLRGEAACRGCYDAIAMEPSIIKTMAALAIALGASGGVKSDLFEYDSAKPFDVRQTGVERRGAVEVTDLTYLKLDGTRNAAYLVAQAGVGSGRPAVLFVHWYGPPAPTSNRTQFLDEAVDLARAGTISLLIETMWSDPDYFRKRLREHDYESSVAQVKELRRALDLLLSRPGVDRARVAYVGHDFGAMYGALAAGVDPRVTAGFVFMAGTRSFSDWFLYGPKMAPADEQAFVERLAPLDPTRYLKGIAPTPILFQFANTDGHVPRPRAEAVIAAAGEPKDVRWYEAGHELNESAARDRQAWLRARLGLAR
jgi:predicted esterase